MRNQNQHSRFLKSLFWLCVQIKECQNPLKPRCWALVFASHKAFLKAKRVLGLLFFPHFLHDLWIETLLKLCSSINWPNFFVWLSLLFEISGNMFIVFVCYPVWVNNIFKIKKILRWNENHYSSFLNISALTQIKQTGSIVLQMVPIMQHLIRR